MRNYSDNYSNNKLNNKTNLDNNNKKPYFIKQKRLFLFHNNLTFKKYKYFFQQRSTCQSKSYSEFCWCFSKSHFLYNQYSNIIMIFNIKNQLFLFVFLVLYIININISPNYHNPG
jgi:hypothetical protein